MDGIITNLYCPERRKNEKEKKAGRLEVPHLLYCHPIEIFIATWLDDQVHPLQQKPGRAIS